MSSRTLAFASAALITITSGASAQETAYGLSLTRQSLPTWRSLILPDNDETAWQQINWLPDLGSGIREARRLNKPILLWTMNGHPFGCT